MENPTTIIMSRMIAQERAIDVTAGNIANAGTPGYHGERMLFSDWLLRLRRADNPPGGATVAYAQDRATWRDARPGELRHTGNALDFALGDADGFFTVQTPRGPRLTRGGHFQLAASGTITDEDGNALLDSLGRPLQLGAADAQVTVAADGTVATENGQIGRVGVVRTADATRLMAEGARLFDASGTTTQASPAPQLIDGVLEDSNVQPMIEVNRMLDGLRQFQFAAQMAQSEADRQSAAIDKLLPRRS